MKPTELRIGNYVYRKGELYLIWLLDKYINLSEYYRGIPLTENWLKKFGFENFKTNHFEFGEYIWFELEFNGYTLSINIGKGNKGISVHYHDGDTHNCLPIENIKYVHQLQNLYFALTGKELEHETKLK